MCLSTGRTLYFERESNATILCLKDYKAEDVIQKLKQYYEELLIDILYQFIKYHSFRGLSIWEI